MIISVNDTQGSEVFILKSSAYDKKELFMHHIEYSGYPLKIRIARGAGLPYVWDDFPTFVYKYTKNWKRNSKRPHQYYKEHME